MSLVHHVEESVSDPVVFRLRWRPAQSPSWRTLTHTTGSINEVQQLSTTPMTHMGVSACIPFPPHFSLGTNNASWKSPSVPQKLRWTVHSPLNCPASLHYPLQLPTSSFCYLLMSTLTLWSLIMGVSCIRDEFRVWSWVSSFSTVFWRFRVALSLSFYTGHP